MNFVTHGGTDQKESEKGGPGAEHNYTPRTSVGSATSFVVDSHSHLLNEERGQEPFFARFGGQGPGRSRHVPLFGGRSRLAVRVVFAARAEAWAGSSGGGSGVAGDLNRGAGQDCALWGHERARTRLPAVKNGRWRSSGGCRRDENAPSAARWRYPLGRRPPTTPTP